jgi:hypothetical protein
MARHDYSQYNADTGVYNPPHTRTTKIPHETPWDVRFALALLPARYLFRSVTNSITDSAAPQILKSITDPLKNAYANQAYSQIEANLEELVKHKDTLFPKGVPQDADEVFDILESSPLGRKFMETNQKLHTRWDSPRKTAFDSLRYYVRRHDQTGKLGLTHISKADIRSGLSGMMFETLYDNSLGLGSLAYTYKVQSNVLADIQSIYSEVVGFEQDKDPAKVSKDDIFNSENRIIQSTVSNYRSKFAKRVGISMIPFAKNVPALRALHLGDFAIGAWGAMWAWDIWGREPTLLESFSWFINDKLNPSYGVGEPIRSADIINLYQQYTLKFDQENAFTRVVANDPESVRIWGQGEKVFQRIADLMNKSYNFKHTTPIDKETGQPEAAENFRLPHFIYLLGHDLIKIREPDWTMAAIEVANKYGIAEVKKIATLEHTPANLQKVIDDYQIDLNPLGHINSLSKPVTIRLNPKTGEAEVRPESKAMQKLAAQEHSAPLPLSPLSQVEAKHLLLEAARLSPAPGLNLS